MKKIAIYTRVSTSFQKDGDSLPYQKQVLEAYCVNVLESNSFVLFEDAGFSGKNTDRPAYKDMLRRIKNGEFNYILVNKIDRISRNLIDFAILYDTLRKYNVVFISRNEQFDTSSAMGEAMLKIILIFAEMERKITAERVTAIMLDRAQKGKWNGAPVPYGYDWDDETKYPAINQKEADVIRFIFSTYLQGTGTTTIARTLNARGIKSKKGVAFHAGSVREIIRNPFYMGTLVYNKKDSNSGKTKDRAEWIVIDNAHPALIPPVDWQKAQDVMTQNIKGHKQEHKFMHIFQGLTHCHCGAVGYARRTRVRKDGFCPSIYACRGYIIDRQCENDTGISDLYLAPFLFQYLRNMLYLQDHFTDFADKADFEKQLLRGDALKDVAGLTPQSLDVVYRFFENANSLQPVYYTTANRAAAEPLPDLTLLTERKGKLEQALERNKKAFLFADIGVSEREYLTTRADLMADLDRINESIKQAQGQAPATNIPNLFSDFMLKQQLSDISYLPWHDFFMMSDKRSIRDFLHTVINDIVFWNKRVLSVTFKNQIRHEFIYRPK